MTERKNYSRLTCNSNRNTLHIFGEFVIFKNIVRKRRKTIHIVFKAQEKKFPTCMASFLLQNFIIFLSKRIAPKSTDSDVFK